MTESIAIERTLNQARHKWLRPLFLGIMSISAKLVRRSDETRQDRLKQGGG